MLFQSLIFKRSFKSFGFTFLSLLKHKLLATYVKFETIQGKFPKMSPKSPSQVIVLELGNCHPLVPGKRQPELMLHFCSGSHLFKSFQVLIYIFILTVHETPLSLNMFRFHYPESHIKPIT